MKSHQSLRSLSLKAGVAILSSALLLSACGERPPEKKATQVAAKVNSGEISVHQINFLLQRIPNIPAAQAEAAKRQVLESLVDQELAVQQAVENKLDRTPEVMQALENARREILARAYIDQASGAKTKPSADEVKKYYAENPALFAERKIYRIEEIVFANTPEAIASVKDMLAKGKGAAEIVTSLKAAGVEVGGNVAVKPAEQIPLEVLPKLAAAKDGQPQLIENAGRTVIITVLASKAEPVDQIKAQPAIESFIANRQKTESVRQVVKQLREKAKIEYVGEFANTQAPAPVETAVPAKGAEAGKDAAMAKGVAGLK